ncbi:MAG: dihydropteroate synthase [Chloroflexi bacterium]|nr:MAG: dihydropteroate synthase [Chloroflexota bacterium]
MAATMRQTRIGEREFHWGSRTFVMGILNVTPDSFSGDGITRVDRAISQARKFEEDGADLIDIGGESTRPETWSDAGLPASEELRRVVPVVEQVAAVVGIPVSIDTYKAEVAQQAVAAGARLINDVWGLRRDPRMAATVAATGMPVVLMHNQPGGQNLEIIRRLPELRSLGFPLLVGPSRKSFIGKTLDLPIDERLEGTAGAVALSIAGGADIIRVHDVKAMVRVARMVDAIVRA